MRKDDDAMSNDGFEQELSRRDMREVPAGWRREILQVALEGVVKEGGTRSLLNMGWLAWVSWRRAAWSGLAAVWVLILGLNWAANRPAGNGSVESLYSPGVMALAWEQSQRLVSGLEEREWMNPRDAGGRPRSAAASGEVAA